MLFVVENTNPLLPVYITVTADDRQTQSAVIPPKGTRQLRFSSFGGPSPRIWTFFPSFNSDGSIVTWKLYSSWVEGDPPNRG
jgi:hypothetical protein